MGIAAENWCMFLILTVDEVEILGQSGLTSRGNFVSCFPSLYFLSRFLSVGDVVW